MRGRLDALLADADEGTGFARLAADPGRVSLESLLAEIAKLERLRALGLPPDLLRGAHPEQIKRFRRRAAIETAWELRRRLKRVAEATIDLFGHRTRKTRVIRTSNGYHFIDPKSSKNPESLGNCSKSDFPTGTPNQEIFLARRPPATTVSDLQTPLEEALNRLGRAIGVVA